MLACARGKAPAAVAPVAVKAEADGKGCNNVAAGLLVLLFEARKDADGWGNKPVAVNGACSCN